MVFDKTGTLTEDGLTVYGFRSMRGEYMSEHLETLEEDHYIHAVASCNSLTDIRGEILGDPLEI